MKKSKSRYRLYPNAVPSYWAKPDLAMKWLAAIGWELRADDRAYKTGKGNIPAPVPPALYDLHDVACEEGWGGTDTAERIMLWARDNGLEVNGVVGTPSLAKAALVSA